MPSRSVSRIARRRTLSIWLMVFASLAWLPGGFSRFVLVKLLVAAAACVLGATVPREGRLPRLLWALCGAGALVFVIASVAGGTPTASLLGRWPRYEGLPVLFLYAGCGWLGARLVGTRRRRLEGLLSAVATMSLVLFGFSALDAIGASPLGHYDVTRTGSLLGNATDQGLVAVMAVALLLNAVLERRTSFLLAGLAAALATIALSGSRTAIIVAVLTVVGLAVARRRAALLPVVGTLVALLAAVLALPQSRDRLLATGTVHGRGLQWQLTWDLIRDHPMLGVGPSRYVDAFGRYEDRAWVRFTGTTHPPDSPHNWLLQAMVAGGFPLLLLAIAVAVLVIHLGWKRVRETPEMWGTFAAVIGYGVALLANFTIAGSTCLAAFLAGIMLSEPAGAKEPAWKPRLAMAAAGLACLGLFGACVADVQVQRGVQLASAGHLVAAERAFVAARHFHPGDGDIAMLGAQAMAGMVSNGNAAAAPPAVRLARASLAKTPQTYQSRVALGVALIAQNRLPQAKRDLNTAVRLFPMRPAAYVQRGIARFGLRDVPGARHDLHRAQRLAPHDRTPTHILSAIRERLAK